MVAIIVLVLLFVIAVVLFSMHSRLVHLRGRCDAAWSDVDVQLNRRHDIISSLAETVQRYAPHEKCALEDIARLCSQATHASTPADKTAAEKQLTAALNTLFALAEHSPELKASEEFKQIQTSLNEAGHSIENARRYYNAVARDMNTKVQSFPASLVAPMLGFSQRQCFEE